MNQYSSSGKLIQSFLNPQGLKKVISILLIFVLLLGCSVLVYTMGGSKLAHVHVFYIPIILAGSLFSVSGGITAALFATWLSGPIMPFDVALEVAQPFESWLLRSTFFFLVGGLSGISAKMVKEYLRDAENRLITDPVTQLLNGKGLIEAWHHNLQGQPGSKLGLIILRIHDLSSIEAILNPNEVMSLFNTIAQGLRRATGEQDIIAALEVGTFAILIHNAKKAKEVVDKCREELGNIFTINDIPVFVNIFYGIAEARLKEDTIMALIHRGRIAAEKAIHNNFEVSIFEEQDETQLLRNAKIIHDLNTSINANELKIFFQPQIQLSTGKVVGLEALTRWPHKELGMIPPSEFIPLAESTLLINPFTKWLLDQAFAHQALWLNKGFDLCLAINFSMKNFFDPTILELLHQNLRKYSIPAEKLEIEVTETSFATNLHQVADALKALRRMGVQIAIDDFGTGQSSLHYLLELPLDVIKIDQVFVNEMLTNSGAEAIVRSAILLGHELKLEVVAEGIQNEVTLKKLTDLKCDYGQGFFFAEPIPAELTHSWLKKNM